jgi:hypothetical protein
MGKQKTVAVPPEDDYDDTCSPLWESVVQLGAELPPEEWDRLPADLASRLDHYLYGSDEK